MFFLLKIKSLLKRPILGFLLSFILLFGFQIVDVFAINRIFLLDTSGSMKSDGLFKQIKESLKRDYVSPMNEGEHITVLTFDEDVVIAVDQKIETSSDTDDVLNRIDMLKARGQWTSMDSAFQMAKQQAEKMKSLYSEDQVNVYILTDGVNDPPPKDGVGPFPSFMELLEHHFSEFDIEGANIFLVSYQSDMSDKESREWEKGVQDGTEGNVTPILPGSQPMPSEIIIRYTGFDLGEIILEGNQSNKSGKIRIKKIIGDAVGGSIHLSVDRDLLNVSPAGFEVSHEGQGEDVSLSLSTDLSPGDYDLNIKLSSERAIVVPNTIPVKFKVLRPTDSNIWKFVVAALCLLALYFLFLMTRTKSFYVKEEGEEKYDDMTVKGLKKTPLKIRGLEHYAVALGVYPHQVFSLFLFKGGEKDSKVLFGEKIPCQDQENDQLKIVFTESEALESLPTENSAPEENVSLWDPDDDDAPKDHFADDREDEDYFK